ncbi:RNA ligase, DRB0094 family [Xylariomycetidae sp. FL0641]|nr:RNA ligase, DRB0094 family [Xylariomycetidae sp. FL0641]
MGRKLVTVRPVSAVQPIQGADRVETVVLDGWTCVAQANQFRAGDPALFFEIDSFLPAGDPRWAYLADKFTACHGRRGFRVQSAKIRGQLSQGIVRPLDDFPEVAAEIAALEAEHGGSAAPAVLRATCFAALLRVAKYEKYEPPPKAWRGAAPAEPTLPLPAFIRRTDQERIQNLPDLFDQWRDELFQETTKMDGSSMTVYFVRKDSPWIDQLPSLEPGQEHTAILPRGRFGVCSRNKEILEREGGFFWEIAKKSDLPAKLSTLDRNIALQGELCGSKIQSNFEGFPEGFHDYFLFSVWDIDQQKYMKPEEAETMAKQLGLNHVQVVGYHRLGDIGTSIQDILKRAEGRGINGRKREGIVLKHVDGLFSFKAISNSYLLKTGE